RSTDHSSRAGRDPQGSEESVPSVVTGGGEVDGIRVSRGDAVADLQCLQAGDGDGPVVGATKLAAEGEVVGWVVHLDVAVPGVGDEQVTTDRPKARRGHGHARGSVECAARNDPLEQLAAAVIDVHESPAPARLEAAVLGGVLLGVSNEQVAADV